MSRLSIAVVSPFEETPPDAKLVIFADTEHFVPEQKTHEMIARAGKYALRHRVFLVTQRFTVEDYLCACMFDPNGNIIGLGQATHLNMSLRQLNLRRSDEITVFDTPFGKTALLVDVDINMPQVCRAAARMGAELLISTQYMPLYDFSSERIDYGAVNAACSNRISVIAVMGAGAAVINSNGHFIAEYTDLLPMSAVIESGISRADIPAMQTAHELLLAHRELIDEPAGGEKR